MARIRIIKPELTTDEKLARVSIPARYLFANLPCHADREGRLVDAPNLIAGLVFPYDKGVDVDALIQELADNGQYKRYELNGEHYIQILNFHKHQTPHPKEKPSLIPASEPCKRRVRAVKSTVPSHSVSNPYPVSNPVSNPTAPADTRPPVEKWLDWRRSEAGQKKLHELLSLTRSDADQRPRLTKDEFREALKDKEQWLRDHASEPRVFNRKNWGASVSAWMKIAYERKKERESRQTVYAPNDRELDEQKLATRGPSTSSGFSRIGGS